MFSGFKLRFSATDLLQRAQAAFIKKRAVIGQPLTAGGPVKQTNPQPLFKTSNAFSYRRARQMQTDGGLGKTSCLNGGNEDGNIFQRIGHGRIVSIWSSMKGKLIATGDAESTVDCQN